MMTRAQLHDNWETFRAARYWAKATDQSLLGLVFKALEKYLDYEQSLHCDYCDSIDVFVNEGVYSTGVVAPDGGHERVYSQWVECRRCRNRSELPG